MRKANDIEKGRATLYEVHTYLAIKQSVAFDLDRMVVDGTHLLPETEKKMTDLIQMESDIPDIKVKAEERMSCSDSKFSVLKSRSKTLSVKSIL